MSVVLCFAVISNGAQHILRNAFYFVKRRNKTPVQGACRRIRLRDARAGADGLSMRRRQAARALGIVIAEAVNAVDPVKVLVTGEGVHMMELAPDAVREGMLEYLEQVEVDSVVVERPEFRFAHYARGAAIAAMRDLV